MTTHQERCEKLAMALEKKPSEPLSSMRSRLGFWMRKNYGNGYEWYAVDFTQSEEASAKLLEAMPCPQLERFTNQWDVPVGWRCLPHVYTQDNKVIHGDRKTAIFEAGCAWKGIE